MNWLFDSLFLHFDAFASKCRKALQAGLAVIHIGAFLGIFLIGYYMMTHGSEMGTFVMSTVLIVSFGLAMAKWNRIDGTVFGFICGLPIGASLGIPALFAAGIPLGVPTWVSVPWMTVVIILLSGQVVLPRPRLVEPKES